MSVVGVVIVSHSRGIARGLADMAREMVGPEARIEAAGGAADGGLGTDSSQVERAIVEADAGIGVVVVGDLGSAILTTKSLLAGDDHDAVLADAPLVEGTIAAVVAAAGGAALSTVVAVAEEARIVRKL